MYEIIEIVTLFIFFFISLLYSILYSLLLPVEPRQYQHPDIRDGTKSAYLFFISIIIMIEIARTKRCVVENKEIQTQVFIMTTN